MLMAGDAEAGGVEVTKNRHFTQVYSKGWRRIRELAQGNPAATGLYAFFGEHIDADCGAVICDQQFLADQFKVTTRSIRRWIQYLESENAITRIPIAGRVCAYALDPHEVWKGYNNSKAYAAFKTKTLTNIDGNIQRKILNMFRPEERTKLEVVDKKEENPERAADFAETSKAATKVIEAAKAARKAAREAAKAKRAGMAAEAAEAASKVADAVAKATVRGAYNGVKKRQAAKAAARKARRTRDREPVEAARGFIEDVGIRNGSEPRLPGFEDGPSIQNPPLKP